MFYSGALSAEQTDAMYTSGLGLTACEILTLTLTLTLSLTLGLTTCEVGRWLTVGSTKNSLDTNPNPDPNSDWFTSGSPSGGNDGRGLIFVHIPQGLPFGLLVHDMVDRFLLYFFTQSAHSQTRGTCNQLRE